MNKEDLRRRNRDLRHNIAKRNQESLKKDQEKKLKEAEKEELKLNKPENSFPPLILTMRKRLARIDPWNGVASMDSKQSVEVVYYKLRQIGMDKIRIVANNIHTWLEFNYDDTWWICDIVAVRKRMLGSPIKKKTDADQPEYTTFSRSFNTMDEYLDVYGADLYLDKDECKILAMKDLGLSAISKINYH